MRRRVCIRRAWLGLTYDDNLPERRCCGVLRNAPFLLSPCSAAVQASANCSHPCSRSRSLARWYTRSTRPSSYAVKTCSWPLYQPILCAKGL